MNNTNEHWTCFLNMCTDQSLHIVLLIHSHHPLALFKNIALTPLALWAHFPHVTIIVIIHHT